MNKAKVRQWDADVKAFPLSVAGTAVRQAHPNATGIGMLVLRHMHRREIRIADPADVSWRVRYAVDRVAYYEGVWDAGKPINPPKRCTGHCCKSFYLSHGPETKDAWAWHFVDGAQITDMVIYLGRFSKPPHEIARPELTEPPKGMRHFYTCRHLKPSGDCAIYASRPSMCRGFPYGHPCNYGGCSSVRAVRSDYEGEVQS